MEAYEELVFLVEGEARARALEQLLLDQQVPVYVHDEPREVADRSFRAVAVPPEFGPRASMVIQYGRDDVALRREGDVVLVLTADDPLIGVAGEEAPISMPDEVASLLDRGEEAVKELVDLVLEGDEELAIAASSALSRLRDPALPELESRWEAALREKNERDLALILAACRTLDHEPPRFSTLFQNVDARLRAFAFRMAADLGITEAAAQLMSGLRDVDEAVREEAAELVFRLTGSDQGYDPSDPGRNGRALDRIAAWLSRRG